MAEKPTVCFFTATEMLPNGIHHIGLKGEQKPGVDEVTLKPARRRTLAFRVCLSD